MPQVKTGYAGNCKMTLNISAEQMAIYRATARQRRQRQARELALRYERAWAVVELASAMLKDQFEAQHVAVFGSVLSLERFHQRSDVDLAVWGLDEKIYYLAVARLQDLDTAIPVDLVETEYAPPALQAIIEQEGVFV